AAAVCGGKGRQRGEVFLPSGFGEVPRPARQRLQTPAALRAELALAACLTLRGHPRRQGPTIVGLLAARRVGVPVLRGVGGQRIERGLPRGSGPILPGPTRQRLQTPAPGTGKLCPSRRSP